MIHYAGSIEYLEVDISSDVDLDIQPIFLSFDRKHWHAAEWIGDVGPTRTARLLIGDELKVRTSTDVWAKISDLPEVPVAPVGRIEVR